MRHFPLRECGYAVGFVVVLAALYVGSYFALVDRKSNRTMLIADLIDLDVDDLRQLEPRYPAVWLQGFFGPIHKIDRKLRPDFWSDMRVPMRIKTY
jgi:hypothetical protein